MLRKFLLYTITHSPIFLGVYLFGYSEGRIACDKTTATYDFEIHFENIDDQSSGVLYYNKEVIPYGYEDGFASLDTIIVKHNTKGLLEGYYVVDGKEIPMRKPSNLEDATRRALKEFAEALTE